MPAYAINLHPNRTVFRTADSLRDAIASVLDEHHGSRVTGVEDCATGEHRAVIANCDGCGRLVFEGERVYVDRDMELTLCLECK